MRQIIQKWGRAMVGEEMVKFCFLYTADYVEVRLSGRMVKKWLLTLKSCVSYAADHTEMRSGDRIVKKWIEFFWEDICWI